MLHVAGFELGNEQNTQYSGAQIAKNFAILHNLTRELWPDVSARPVLLGPDPHSFHGPTGVQVQCSMRHVAYNMQRGLQHATWPTTCNMALRLTCSLAL
jgi:hypothetical protein